MPAPPPDTLCYGDCLEWMGRWDDATVDLIYLDPPFNSNANYNVLYARDSAGGAQTRAFVDTWSWDAAAGDADQVGVVGDPGVAPGVAPRVLVVLGDNPRAVVNAYPAAADHHPYPLADQPPRHRVGVGVDHHRSVGMDRPDQVPLHRHEGRPPTPARRRRSARPGCSACPKSRPSRRREPRWSVVARAVAQALDAPAAEVRSIVRAAVAADRGRGRRTRFTSPVT